jgi:hypothetical protein
MNPTLNKLFFSQPLNRMNSTFDKLFFSHPLNKDNCKKFIKSSDITVREIVKKIIDNTNYISYIELKRNLSIIINNLIIYILENKKEEVYIFQNKKNKNKSNYWISLFLIYKLKDSNIKYTIIDNYYLNIKNDDIIIFIDDCIYSGEQMSSILKTFIISKKIKSLNICLVVPYISTIGKQLIIKEIDKHNLKLFFYKELTENTSTILTDDEIEKIEDFYPDEDDIINNFKNKYLIYFDHKLADGISTIPLFYSGVMPTFYNKLLLENLKTEHNPAKRLILENKLKSHMIPLITNCEHIRNLDIAEPECPKPPYKLNYSSFIKKYKLNSKRILKSY